MALQFQFGRDYFYQRPDKMLTISLYLQHSWKMPPSADISLDTTCIMYKRILNGQPTIQTLLKLQQTLNAMKVELLKNTPTNSDNPIMALIYLIIFYGKDLDLKSFNKNCCSLHKATTVYRKIRQDDNDLPAESLHLLKNILARKMFTTTFNKVLKSVKTLKLTIHDVPRYRQLIRTFYTYLLYKLNGTPPSQSRSSSRSSSRSPSRSPSRSRLHDSTTPDSSTTHKPSTSKKRLASPSFSTSSSELSTRQPSAKHTKLLTQSRKTTRQSTTSRHSIPSPAIATTLCPATKPTTSSRTMPTTSRTGKTPSHRRPSHTTSSSSCTSDHAANADDANDADNDKAPDNAENRPVIEHKQTITTTATVYYDNTDLNVDRANGTDPLLPSPPRHAQPSSSRPTQPSRSSRTVVTTKNEYTIGDRVWAKLKGYPYCPATIRKVLTRSSYEVQFYDKHGSIGRTTLKNIKQITHFRPETVPCRSKKVIADIASQYDKLMHMNQSVSIWV